MNQWCAPNSSHRPNRRPNDESSVLFFSLGLCVGRRCCRRHAISSVTICLAENINGTISYRNVERGAAAKTVPFVASKCSVELSSWRESSEMHWRKVCCLAGVRERERVKEERVEKEVRWFSIHNSRGSCTACRSRRVLAKSMWHEEYALAGGGLRSGERVNFGDGSWDELVDTGGRAAAMVSTAATCATCHPPPNWWW